MKIDFAYFVDRGCFFILCFSSFRDSCLIF